MAIFLRSNEWKGRKRCRIWPSWLYLRWTLRLVWCRKDLEQWSQMYFFFLVWIFSCLSKSDLKTKLFGQKAQFSKGLCSNRPPTWSSELLLLLLKQKSQSFNLSREEMVFCYQNCSDLLWEKNVLVIEKNFEAESFQNFWDHLNNLFKQLKVGTIFGKRMLF